MIGLGGKSCYDIFCQRWYRSYLDFHLRITDIELNGTTYKVYKLCLFYIFACDKRLKKKNFIFSSAMSFQKDFGIDIKKHDNIAIWQE